MHLQLLNSRIKTNCESVAFQRDISILYDMFTSKICTIKSVCHNSYNYASCGLGPQNVNKNVMPIVETCIDPPSAHFSCGIIEGVAHCMDSTIHSFNAPYRRQKCMAKVETWYPIMLHSHLRGMSTYSLLSNPNPFLHKMVAHGWTLQKYMTYFFINVLKFQCNSCLSSKSFGIHNCSSTCMLMRTIFQQLPNVEGFKCI